MLYIVDDWLDGLITKHLHFNHWRTCLVMQPANGLASFLGLELGDPGLHLLDLGLDCLLHALVQIGVLSEQVVAVAGVLHDEDRVRVGRAQGATRAEVG